MLTLRLSLSFLVLTGTLVSLSAFAGDIEAGKRAAAACAACHGPAGISGSPLWPNLAGQKKDYILKQIQAFRKDERKDPLMTPMAKTLSESDLENVAEYFSSLSRF